MKYIKGDLTLPTQYQTEPVTAYIRLRDETNCDVLLISDSSPFMLMSAGIKQLMTIGPCAVTRFVLPVDGVQWQIDFPEAANLKESSEKEFLTAIGAI